MKKGTDDDDDSDTDELIELDIDKWDAWFYEDWSDDVSDTEEIDFVWYCIVFAFILYLLYVVTIITA